MLQEKTNKTHKAQRKIVLTYLTHVFEAQTIPLATASARVLLSRSFLFAMVSVGCL